MADSFLISIIVIGNRALILMKKHHVKANLLLLFKSETVSSTQACFTHNMENVVLISKSKTTWLTEIVM